MPDKKARRGLRLIAADTAWWVAFACLVGGALSAMVVILKG